jgi:hypothetical protein
MPRTAYEVFSVVLPEGWSDVLEDATYSDPDAALPPITFAAKGGPGTMHVSAPLFPRDAQPGASVGAMEALARAWGEGRGLATPLALSSRATPIGGLAQASYALGDDFVEVWFVSDGRGVLCASYVCPFAARDVERDAREAIVASLRFT